MSLFTIYNPDTKEIAGEFEFSDYRKAGEYTKENFPEGFISKHEPFHFRNDFLAMLKPNNHPNVLSNRWGVCGIDVEKELWHCGGITLQEHVNMKAAGIKMKSVSKIEFITLANKLADEK